MTKTELIARLAARSPGLQVKDSSVAVDTILDALAATLSNGDRIEIRGFGAFSICYRAPRAGRNPKTGAAVAVAGKVVPRFKTGKLLREAIDSASARSGPSPQDRLNDLMAQIPPGTRFEEIDFGPAVGRELL
jgi:integration host factor subunit beta